MGIHVVRALCESGHSVVSVSRGGAEDAYWRYLGSASKRARFVSADIRNLEEIGDVMREHHIDGIIHAAGITTEVHAVSDPLGVFTINAAGTATMLEAARIGEVSRFVYIGSSSEYGRRTDMAAIREEEVRVEGLYAETKHIGHRLTERYREVFGLDTVSVRVSSVYGPFTRPDPMRGLLGNGLMVRLCEAAAFERDIAIEVDENDVRGWTYGTDTALGIALVFDARSPSHRVYNVASGTYSKVAEVVNVVRELAPSTSITVTQRRSDGFHKAAVRGPLDISRARSELGFSPSVDLRTGLGQYIRWMKDEKVAS